jgi:hypothetical protein
MPSLIYVQPETAITWRNTAGTAVLTLTSVAASAGRQGALHDFGALTARSRRYEWRAFVKFATAPVVGDIIDIYLKTGDGTHRDNDDGTGDAAVSSVNKLRNLVWIGAIEVDEASTTPEFSASGEIEVSAREVAPVFWNGTADALSATAGDHGFDLTPKPDEVQ